MEGKSGKKEKETEITPTPEPLWKRIDNNVQILGADARKIFLEFRYLWWAIGIGVILMAINLGIEVAGLL